jgi:TrmH family RNA methyltransferase
MESIYSRKNPKVIHLKKLGASSAYRRQQREFLCDGEKLLDEAVRHNVEITAVMYCDELHTAIASSVPVYQTTRAVIESVSPMKAPQNVLFSCRMPSPDASQISGRRHIILEGIQDPGNVGTIIRTANAFFVDTVILTGACADLYNPKTVRATMGALFRQRIVEMDMRGLVALKSGGTKIYGAALCDSSCNFQSVSLDNVAVAIGNEGHGLSAEMLSLCDEKVIIPMNPECESLNAAVAASVFMWEMYQGK